MNHKFLISFFVCSFFFFLNSSAQEIDSLLICKNVKNHVAIESGKSFPKGEKVYCWMRIKNATVGQEINIEWYNEEKLMHSTKLNLPLENMRTYAYKTLHQGGKWKVSIKANGKELKSLDFESSN